MSTQRMSTQLIHRWTVDDYHRIVATGILAEAECELLRGEIVDMPSEGPEHAHLCEIAARYLEQIWGDGWWARQGKPITLTDSEPQPDITIVQMRDYRDRHPLPAEIDLVVEYSATTQTKDKGVKQEIYAQANIPHYLVVDLKSLTVVYYSQPVQGQYSREQTFRSGSFPVGAVQVDAQRLLL